MRTKIGGVFWFQFVVLHFTHNSVPVPFTSLRDGHMTDDEEGTEEGCVGCALSRDWGNYLLNIETRVSQR